jgi:hypothetical protein
MLTVTIPGLRLVSEANAHEHWRKRSARAKSQRLVVSFLLGPQSGVPAPHPVPLVVTIKRVGSRLMDSDNVVGAAKHVRDAIAKWLGRDDGPKGCVEWRVEQRKGPYSVEIRIETEDEHWPKRLPISIQLEQIRKITRARGSRREEVA